MNLLNAASFAAMCIAASDTLKRISDRYIRSYENEQAVSDFDTACEQQDYKTANLILGNTIEAMTGYDSISTAFSILADKFPELRDQINAALLNAVTEKEKVLVINRYADRMLEIIDWE